MGRYYKHYDNSPSRFHPAYLYAKNDRKNRYKIICFTHQKTSRVRRLNENINPRERERVTYVMKNPLIVKRNRLGSQYIGYRIVDPLDKHTIRMIKRKK